MKLSDRFDGILGYFSANVPVAQSELNFSNPYELLVAVMLSAQCTDKRVNLTTPEIFRRYPNVSKLAEATVEEIYELIRSISYPNAKARHLKEAATKIRDEFNGEIPQDIDTLMTLPGVGRKTANVIASIVWGEAVIAVDTHVFRVSHRLGLSNGKTPDAVERDLEKHIPEKLRPIAHHWLILHGRYVCTAKKPDCTHCPIQNWCKEYNKNTKN